MTIVSARCSCCDGQLDMLGREPTFVSPQAYVDLESTDRDKRGRTTSDLCIIDGVDGVNSGGSWDRVFVRAVMPVALKGRDMPMHWGLWVELPSGSAEKWERIKRYFTLDRDPEAAGTTFPADLANRLPGYPETVGLPGHLHLVAPTKRPKFVLEQADHPLVQELKTPVSQPRVHTWLMQMQASGGV